MAMFFESGRDALSVVSENNGMWNWCFIGPDAIKLPLVAGGSGSVDEMRACLAAHTEHAVIFGMLRLSFGTGKMRRSKYVFIVASNEEGDAPKTAVVTGRAMSQRGAIEKEIQSYVLLSVSMEVKRASDLTLESIVESVSKKVIIDGQHNKDKKASPEVGASFAFDSSALREAMAEEQAAKEAAAAAAHADSPTQSEAGDHAGEDDDLEHDEELHEEVQAMAQDIHRAAAGAAPAAEAAESSPAPAAEDKGDDEAAAQAADDKPAEQPTALPPGAASDAGPAVSKEASIAKPKAQCPGKHELSKISGNKGACDICNMEFNESVFVMGCPICNWAACIQCYHDPKRGEDSLVPQPPEEPPPLSGLMLKQATNFFAEWQLRSFEVSKGRIRYWPDHASRNAGYRPKYEYSLLNATVALIKSSDSRFQLTLKGSKAMERAPYMLMANIAAVATPEEAKFRHSREDWVLALVQHTVYAKKDLAFRRAAALVQRSLG